MRVAAGIRRVRIALLHAEQGALDPPDRPQSRAHREMSLRVYAYENCDTCRKALKFLAAKKVAAEVIPIRQQPPTIAELRKMLEHTGGDLRRLFNTAGQDYRALDMKTRLPKLSVDEAMKLLTSNGN